MLDLSNVEGVIIDCDGTVLDTLGAWEEAERELFAQSGPVSPELEERIHSVPFQEACRIFHEELGVMGSAEEVKEHLDSYLMPYYRFEAKTLPGVVDFIRMLESEMVFFAVLSSSPRRYIEAGLGNNGLLGSVYDIITTEETECSKHDAAIYERALMVLGSAKETTLAIDDAPYAIRTMSDFGFKTIAPLNGCDAEREKLLRASADIVVGTLEELVS